MALPMLVRGSTPASPYPSQLVAGNTTVGQGMDESAAGASQAQPIATGGSNWWSQNGFGNTGVTGGAQVTDQQSALQAALGQGLTGQAAVDWVQQNYPQFNQYGSGIEWQPSTGTYGMQGGYFAQNPQTGTWGLVPRGGGAAGGLSGGSQQALSQNPGYGIFQNLAGGMSPTQIMQADPGYQFALQQGQDAIQRSAAAKGTLLTGGTLKDLAGYTAGAAAQDYGNIFNRQLQLAGLGSGLQNQAFNQNLGLADLGYAAAQGQNALASSYGTNVANLLANQGIASSAGSTAQGNIWGNYLGGLGGLMGIQGSNPSNPYGGVTPQQSAWWNTGNQGPVI